MSLAGSRQERFEIASQSQGIAVAADCPGSDTCNKVRSLQVPQEMGRGRQNVELHILTFLVFGPERHS